MKSFVSEDNTLEVLIEIPEHRELLEIKKRELEGFTVAHRAEYSFQTGPGAAWRTTTINLVFKK